MARNNNHHFMIWIMEWNEKGIAPRQIADELNRRGICNHKGKCFTGCGVANHLTNRGIGIVNRSRYIPPQAEDMPKPVYSPPLWDFWGDNLNVRD